MVSLSCFVILFRYFVSSPLFTTLHTPAPPQIIRTSYLIIFHESINCINVFLLDDEFTFVPPSLVNISSKEVIIATYCPNIYYWTFKSSVAWARPVGNLKAPAMAYTYQNSSNITLSGLKPFTNQTMHITCVGEEYSLFLTGFPTFKTLPDGMYCYLHNYIDHVIPIIYMFIHSFYSFASK